MDRKTLMLELKGLSRVVDTDVRYLIIKRRILLELSDDYALQNPFFCLVDEIEGDLAGAVKRKSFDKLSTEERTAFLADWRKMRPDEQFDYLDRYVGVIK